MDKTSGPKDASGWPSHKSKIWSSLLPDFPPIEQGGDDQQQEDERDEQQDYLHK